MQIDELLARSGLAAKVRLLVLASVAVWRGDWPRLAVTARAARACHRPRKDLEEILLQSVLFCGFPRVVTAFDHLDEAWPAPEPPHGGGLPEQQRAAAGRELFARIYGRNDEAVRAMLAAHHQELHDFVLDAAYGRILSRPHLDGRVREIVAVAVLAAQGQTRQFVGHARGAQHLGATKEELREALVTTFADPADVERWFALLR